MKKVCQTLTKTIAFVCVVACFTTVTFVNAVTKIDPIKIKTCLSKGKTVSSVKLSKGVLNFIENVQEKPLAKLYFDPEKTYDLQLTDDGIVKYFGREFRPSYVPAGIKEYDSGNTWFIKMNKDGSVAYDVVTVTYGESNEDFLNPFRKELNVKVSKGKLPITCVILTSDTKVDSNINGVKIGVGHSKIGYNYNDNGKPEGYTDSYLAEFMYKGIGYQINSNNISQEEFIKVLLSIVK